MSSFECFHFFNVKHLIDVLDSKNYSGSVIIMSESEALKLDIWQVWKQKRIL